MERWRTTNVRKHCFPLTREAREGVDCMFWIELVLVYVYFSVCSKRSYGSWCFFSHKCYILNIDPGANDFRPVYPSVYKSALVPLICPPSSFLLQCYIISASLHGLCVYTNKCGGRRKSCLNVNCHSGCTLCECLQSPQKMPKRKRHPHPHTDTFVYILLLIRLWVTVAAN